MLNKISLESVFSYLKTTPIYRLVFHSLVVIFTVFCLSTIYVGVMHFDKFLVAISYQENSEKLVRELEEDIRSSLELNFELEKLIQETGSNRATFYKFHNGKASLRGISFLYQSASHQQLNKGISSTISAMQEIPLTIDPSGLQNLLNNTCYNVDVADYNLSVKDIYENIGTNYVINCPIFNGTFIVGYVSLEYFSKPDDILRNKEILLKYRQRIEKINNDIKIFGN